MNPLPLSLLVWSFQRAVRRVYLRRGPCSHSSTDAGLQSELDFDACAVVLSSLFVTRRNSNTLRTKKIQAAFVRNERLEKNKGTRIEKHEIKQASK